MKLTDLLQFNQIVIQCHDNPDADAIASGFGLYQYLIWNGKSPRFIYSGQDEIQKSNLRHMIDQLRIPIEYVEELEKPELLLLTDCQYAEGNVRKFEADHIAVIDHHEICIPLNEWTEIRPGYGSCSTVVYSMLLDEKVNVNAESEELATALYYGLYMDTNCFGEIRHPFDLDMMEDLRPNDFVMNYLRNNNFSINELEITGIAISNYEYIEEEHFAVVQADPCDPNILGFISDLLLQVDKIDICVVYNDLDYGFKLSVRSCSREATANDIAQYLTKELGSGGGHKRKAGGFIIESKYFNAYSELKFQDYIIQSMKEYFKSFDVLDTQHTVVDTTGMKKYEKLPVPIGFVKTMDFAEEDTALLVRTLEGDVSIIANPDIYIMIGIDGEVYPMDREKFEQRYDVLDFAYTMETEYQPTVRNKRTEEIYQMVQYAKSCVSNRKTYIYARQIDKPLKVFTQWGYDDYMLGNKGDYLAIQGNYGNDAYIIKERIMRKTYHLVAD